ncbi:MAG: UDP-N-acetylmuramoyl-L-alanine--D-glutamate ligase [Clostridia bacterium]|nr:UDP-N-acetylmuramoyl-L-alanine--D-glutamate ligase [Clostridia bacterium]
MKAKIIGYGISGKAAESYLEARGIETIVVADAKEKVSGDYDFCVVSPGVPQDDLKDEIVPIVPEVELPFFCEKKLKPRYLVAVTGTNGKTTIVNLIHRMCTLAKKKSVLCGNVGVPVSRVANKLSKAIAIFEISSFMLEQTNLLHPQIAVISNITPDHLDRHHTMEEYIRCKAKIIEQQTKNDYLVINWDNTNTRMLGMTVERSKKVNVIWYSTHEVVNGYYLHNGEVWEKLGRRTKCLGSATAFSNMEHVISNVLAVIAVGRRLRLSTSVIWQACEYKSQRHRMELVADFDGVAFYNDSKATNMASTLAALSAIKMPTCLILCGLSKGQDYRELLTQLPEHVIQVFVFGSIKEQVLSVAQSLELSQIKSVLNLKDAVKNAMQCLTRPGVVLFSPSGSSFDSFINYQHRGDEFCKIVQDIIGRKPQYLPLVDGNL